MVEAIKNVNYVILVELTVILSILAVLLFVFNALGLFKKFTK
jgi:hypothetical protein